jgi:hypothetical protein
VKHASLAATLGFNVIAWVNARSDQRIDATAFVFRAGVGCGLLVALFV